MCKCFLVSIQFFHPRSTASFRLIKAPTATNPGEGGGKICHFYSKFIVIFGYQKKSKREEKEKKEAY